MRVLMPLPVLQRRLSQQYSQIGLQYGFTPLSRHLRERALPGHAKQAGERVPEVEVACSEEPNLRLYTLLRAAAYTLLVIVSPLHSRRERAHLVDLAKKIQHRFQKGVRTYVVMEEGLPDTDIDLPVLVDIKRQVRTRLGATHGSILLLRPDGYLAFHTRTQSEKQILSLCQPWLSLPGESAEDSSM